MKTIKLYLMTISLLICGLNLAAINTIAQKKESFSKGQKYSVMSEQVQREFISKEAEKILDKFGQSQRDPIPVEGITSIKSFIDGYKKRIRKTRTDSCLQQSWLTSDLTSILQRGKQRAPMIARGYREKEIEPIIGLYVAMVESEFCPCLQSPTGPLGMFQLTTSWGKLYGLDTKRGATPVNPDERCSPEKAAGASASFFKYMIGYLQERIGNEYGNNGIGIPLAISAYNAGEGSLRRNVETVSKLIPSDKTVTFWDLAANQEKLSQQFQKENIKYFPKFMAAVIIGENPAVFGISGIKPLSDYFGKAIPNPSKTRASDINNPKGAEASPKDPEVSIDFWRAQFAKSREDREGPTGNSPAGLKIPASLRNDGNRKQRAKINEMKENGYQIPMDFADLARKLMSGELVAIPMATDSWVLDVGGSSNTKPFETFTFASGGKVASPESSDYKVLSKLAENFSGKKYDLNNPNDRRQMKIGLLRMLHPRAYSIVQELSKSYHAKFKRPLRITSMARSMQYQIDLNKTSPNSYRVRGDGALPPHVSGCAFDISRKFMTANEQNFVMEKLAEMEKEGKLDAVIFSNDVIALHVFVYNDGKPPHVR